MISGFRTVIRIHYHKTVVWSQLSFSV